MTMSSALQQRHQRVQHGIDRRGRHHQPDRARLGQCLDEIRQAGGALGTLGHQIAAPRRRGCHRRRSCGRPSSGARPCWRPCGPGRSCRVASLSPSCYVGFAAMACLAAATTWSTVKPKCSATTLIGADMPKRVHAQHDARGSGIAMPAERRAFLHGHARRHAGGRTLSRYASSCSSNSSQDGMLTTRTAIPSAASSSRAPRQSDTSLPLPIRITSGLPPGASAST